MFPIMLALPYTRMFQLGKILVNYTGKSHWGGKIWQICYSQCVCQIHFWRICEFWQGKFWKIAHDLRKSPAKIFLCTVYA